MQNIENVVKKIPDHLREFVVDQDQTNYRPVDHAVWRYILRQLKNYLGKNAHSCYLDGLQKTGITVNSIPSIDGICKKLQEFGWSAVPVSGFIPPAAFMEMQSLAILPIATDMRSIDHLLYTPAPDIVHEAAGHAPILVNPEFAKYLKQYAAVAKNAIISSQDLALYEAIRDLSDIKEHPSSTKDQIQAAQSKLEHTAASMTVTSEATLLGRMNWWTAEYGLIGDLENPKIYGAGLLSSYGEARSCLKPQVKKIPLTVDCVDFSYDITEPQPQLFVAPSFSHLTQVLNELSMQLSYKRGGTYGLGRAKDAKTVNTIQLNSGLQISGVLNDFIESDGGCIYFNTQGPTQLSVGNKELSGHDKNYHSHGYSSPVGFVDGFEDCLSWASDEDLEEHGIKLNQKVTLRYESGVIVQGNLRETRRTPRGELCLMSFTECHVSLAGRTLFDPSWGVFDMAVGSKVESVFAGPADRDSFGLTDSFAKKRVPAKVISTSEQKLNQIYQEIRDARNNKPELDQITSLWKKVESNHKAEWLPQLELLELTHQTKEGQTLQRQITESLQALISTSDSEKASVIEDGIKLADKSL